MGSDSWYTLQLTHLLTLFGAHFMRVGYLWRATNEHSTLANNRIIVETKCFFPSASSKFYFSSLFLLIQYRIPCIVYPSTVYDQWKHRRCWPWSNAKRWWTCNKLQTKHVSATKSTSKFNETHSDVWSNGSVWLNAERMPFNGEWYWISMRMPAQFFGFYFALLCKC